MVLSHKALRGLQKPSWLMDQLLMKIPSRDFKSLLCCSIAKALGLESLLESGASEGGAHQITDFCIRSLTSASDSLQGANFAISVSLLGTMWHLCSQRRWVWVTVSPEAMVGRLWATARLLHSCRHPCYLGAPHTVSVCLTLKLKLLQNLKGRLTGDPSASLTLCADCRSACPQGLSCTFPL